MTMQKLWRGNEPVVLMDDIILEQSPDYIRIAFSTPREVLSSAILGGGLIYADYVFNKKVDKYPSNTQSLSTPDTYLQEYAHQQQWYGNAVAMMTAASMNSLRVVKHQEQNISIAVLATVGLANARRAGDKAEVQQMGEPTHALGTINLIAVTDASLTPSALVEAQMIMTEAKAAIMQELNIRSPISNEIATGTGTDAIAIVNGPGMPIKYCGKHVRFGELLATCVIDAIRSSHKPSH